MKRILPYTDAEITLRVARRRAKNMQYAKRLRSERAAAEREHIAREHGVSREVAAELAGVLRPRVAFEPSPAANAIRQAAEDELPSSIASEIWRVGDCSCVLHRVYDRSAPEDAQTFHAEPCSAHAGLTLDVLHDTIREETLRRAGAHRAVEDAGGEVRAFEWDASRELTVRATIVPAVDMPRVAFVLEE